MKTNVIHHRLICLKCFEWLNYEYGCQHQNNNNNNKFKIKCWTPGRWDPTGIQNGSMLKSSLEWNYRNFGW